MKKQILNILVFTGLCLTANAQSNTFPTTGNVGIGTITPQAALDIKGLIQISGINAATPPSDISYGLFPYGGIGLGIFSGAYGPNQGIGIWTNPNGIKTEVMRILSGGNIGIGTTNPVYKLDVIGTIRSREVKVDLNGADFVFEKDYRLMPLSELEKYIQTEKHLPEIATAKEMGADGVELGSLNSKLLQKVEELTLYIIDQKKSMDDIKEIVNSQNKKILKLENTSKQ